VVSNLISKANKNKNFISEIRIKSDKKEEERDLVINAVNDIWQKKD
jgi:hypothetical protein